MSKHIQTIAPIRRDGEPGTSALDDLLNSASWEQRLEEARAQRERLLAEKLPLQPESGRKPPVARSVRLLAALSGITSRPINSFRKRLTRQSATMMACSLFLGFGFALGLGMAQAIGWVSSEPESLEAGTAQPQTDPAPHDTVALNPPTEQAPPESVGLDLDAQSLELLSYQPLIAPDPAIEDIATSLQVPQISESPDLEPPSEAPKPQTSEPIAQAVASIADPLGEPPLHSGPEVVSNPEHPIEGVETDPSPQTEAPLSDTMTLAARYIAGGGNIESTNLRVYAPRSVPESELEKHVTTLEETGFQFASPKRINMRISSPHLRFYDKADEDLARAIGQEIGMEARDFSASGNGRPGLIEVWLDGNGGGMQTQRRAKTAQPRSQFMTDLIQLRRQLARKLR